MQTNYNKNIEQYYFFSLEELLYSNWKFLALTEKYVWGTDTK